MTTVLSNLAVGLSIPLGTTAALLILAWLP